ncbi:MAG: serine/threonine-protein kinase [Acidimicrobiales bacterium]
MDAGEDRILAGRNRVSPLLGQGGSACVYDGYDTRLARPVAIKQLRPEVAADLAMRRRFEQEGRTAARLTHPNAVAVYDTGEEAGHTFFVMERLPGRSLADRIADGPMGAAEAAGVAADVLAALRAAHSLGMVHRDVKPGNILLTEEGRAKVGDFGIATSLDLVLVGDTTMVDATVLGLVIGTPAYLAPERLTGEPATERTDLYALGVVLFETLTGAKPEPGATSVPGASPALAAVALRALSPRVADRFASAAEMAAALRAGLAPSVSETTLAARCYRASRRPTPGRPERRRAPWRERAPGARRSCPPAGGPSVAGGDGQRGRGRWSWARSWEWRRWGWRLSSPREPPRAVTHTPRRPRRAGDRRSGP